MIKAEANGHPSPPTELVAGLPRVVSSPVAPPPPIPDLPAQSNLVDLDTLAAELHADGFCLWLRFDGEEFVVDLLCGVGRLAGNQPRPRGRGVTAAAAIAAAVADKEEVLKRSKSKF